MTTVELSSNQELFAGELQKDTGLNLDVIDAWLRNEEPAESSNGALGANNFLNIGITGSSPSEWYGYANSVWDNPVSAADATANWMKGKPIGGGGASPTGYGAASGPIQGILSTAGKSPEAQINAIQTSGWAGGHAGTVTETNIPSLYNELVGGGAATLPGASPNLTAAATKAGQSLPASSPTPSAGSSGLWNTIVSDAKHAVLFVAILAVGAVLMVKGLGANGVKTPKLNISLAGAKLPEAAAA